MRNRSTLPVAILSLSALGCADGVETVRPLVEQANIELEEAYKDGDAARLASLFTEDALVMPNGGRDIPGREAVANLFERIFTVNTVLKYQLAIQELEVVDGTAIERGVFDYQAVSARQDTTADQGRYVIIRKKGPGGAWLIHRWMENVSPGESHPFMQQ